MIDIDKFLARNDLFLFLKYGLTWPWSITHLLIAEKLFGCGNILSSFKKKHAFKFYESNGCSTVEYTIR